MNILVTAAQRLSQPCGPLPVKGCRVRREGKENGKKHQFRRRTINAQVADNMLRVSMPAEFSIGACC